MISNVVSVVEEEEGSDMEMLMSKSMAEADAKTGSVPRLLKMEERVSSLPRRFGRLPTGLIGFQMSLLKSVKFL